MNEILKYLGGALRRTYDAIIERPLPWRMIDKLVSLEERCERDAPKEGETPPDRTAPGEPGDGDARS
ncbi:hypothetical protein [Hyphomicrobium sp.]|uniref:hypothetical protein n=1 Tax=Hyphomicrobium sp. TaxID=82 RepID=UPI0025C32A6C|nr:hypothetical protein [Hyphomicrobium sp.]MCC7251786.1 hypothetical protein [Hyphomicrobium sp.]